MGAGQPGGTVIDERAYVIGRGRSHETTLTSG